MRKISLLLSLFVMCVSSAMAKLPERKTYLYAVKGADSLYLDHYSANVEGYRPCVIYIFGGGFVNGVRYQECMSHIFKCFLMKVMT